MENTVLLITAMDGAENLARALSREAHAVVEIAHSRRAALARLRRDTVTAVLLDSSLPNQEMTTTEMVLQNAQGAVCIEIHLAVLGINGIVGLIRSVLEGRASAEALGREVAIADVARELRSTLTSLLLQSDLLLRDSETTPSVAARAREVKELVDSMRYRLHINSTEKDDTGKHSRLLQ